MLSKAIFRVSKNIIKNRSTAIANVSRHFSTEKSSPINCSTTLSEDEQMFRDSVRKFALKELDPIVAKMEQQSFMEPDIIKKLFDNGLMGIEVPEEMGGASGSFLMANLAVEELARVDPVVALLVDIHTMNVALLRNYGSAEQHAKWLPRMASDAVTCFALSEPGSGSDAFAMRTTATKLDGGGFVLNGEKCWISNAEEAELFFVFANAAPELGHRGISVFVVPRETPGFSIGKREDKLGLRSSATCPIHFDNARIPADHLIGQLGHGYKYALETLNTGRVGIAFQMIGIARGALAATWAHLNEREQFSQPLWKFQAVRHQFARLYAQQQMCRTFAIDAARRVDQFRAGHFSNPLEKEKISLENREMCAALKLAAAEMAGHVSSSCIDLMGGLGFTKSYRVEKFYRDSKIGTIYEGTSNIQLNTIADCLDKLTAESNENLFD